MKLKEKKIIQGLVIFFSIVVVLLSLIGDKGLLQLMELKKQEKKLQQEIIDLKREKKEWVNKVKSLKNNQTYIETIAREELNMVRNNEILIKLRREEDHE